MLSSRIYESPFMPAKALACWWLNWTLKPSVSLTQGLISSGVQRCASSGMWTGFCFRSSIHILPTSEASTTATCLLRWCLPNEHTRPSSLLSGNCTEGSLGSSGVKDQGERMLQKWGEAKGQPELMGRHDNQTFLPLTSERGRPRSVASRRLRRKGPVEGLTLSSHIVSNIAIPYPLPSL